VQIDWSFLDAVNWAEVAWLSAITFLATLIGNILILRHWFWAAIVAGVLFAAGYLFLAYYPHERPVPGLKRAAASPARPDDQPSTGSRHGSAPSHWLEGCAGNIALHKK
jgi:hypothetical protein